MARRRKKSRDWFVAQTWDSAELEARRNLRKLGFEAEYPLYRMDRNLRGERRVSPLFPGYVFVRNCEAWSGIREARGVAGLVMNDGRPSRILDVDIQFFLTESVDECGYYVDPSVRVFRPGDIARPGSGRFAGIGGEFSRMVANARCELNYWIMGQKLTITHPVTDLT